MSVDKVTFGNFPLGAQRNNTRKEEPNKEAIEAKVDGKFEQGKSEPESFLNALDMLGVQNQVQVSKKKDVNPADYLTQDRIADIEAMMGKFENGVDVVANAIEAELPGFFTADAKYALAANIYAQE